ALSEVSLGIMPGGMGTQNLPRAVGERRAKEMILTARPFTAAEGKEWRLVKKSIHFGLQMDLMSGYRFEIEAYNRLVDTADRREGVKAFNEKRKPRFEGK